MGSIAFLVFAGTAVGHGHLLRCIKIAKHLNDARFLIAKLPDAESSLKSAVARGIEHVRLVDDDEETILQELKSIENLTAVVVDRREYATAYLQNNGWQVIAWDNPVADADLHIKSWEDDSGQRAIAGSTYWPVERPVAVKQEHPMTIRRVMISCGYTDPLGLTPKIAACLLSFYGSEKPEIVCIVTSAQSEESVRKLEQLAVTIKKDVDDMASLMLSADLMITTGGGTLLEAVSLGMPTIAVPTGADNDRQAAFFAGTVVVGNTGEEMREGVTEKMMSAIAAVQPKEMRESLSERAKSVDIYGAERIAQAIMELSR